MALAFKIKNEGRVAVSFFGEGALNTRAFHEGLNMTAVYNLSAVFICENNQYSASTSVRKVIKNENIADSASSYLIEGVIGDGMDVIDIYDKSKIAIDKDRDKYEPTLLELKTFRFCGHSRSDPDNYLPQKKFLV